VAARTGTTVFLEPLNRYQDHMINTLADARRYIVEGGLKHVKIIGDFYHMNIEEDNLCRAFHDNRDLLGHVHIADNHRYQPGSGAIDFHAAFDQLRADGYDGYIVYECRIRADDPALAYRQSLDFLRQEDGGAGARRHLVEIAQRIADRLSVAREAARRFHRRQAESEARAASRTRTTRAGAASVSKRPAGNC